MLSWAINRPGFTTARRIVWREVRNADLPAGLNVGEWFDTVLADRGETESVAFLTSRTIVRYQTAVAHAGETTAFAVATVGLSNAERVGQRRRVETEPFGTINVAAYLDKAYIPHPKS